MISSEDNRILEEFAHRIRERYPDARVWAFGSRARGDSEWDSDFDACVVMPRMDREQRGFIQEVAFQTGLEHSRVIIAICYSLEQFERGIPSSSLLVRTIQEEGIAA